MPSSMKPLAKPLSGESDSPVVDWNVVPGQEPETVLKTPRGELAEVDMLQPAAPSFWRQLFPPPSEVPEPAPVVDPARGISLGHFVIERRIGAGAMGAVFLAFDERLRRDVALKILAPTQASDPNTVQRFQNEAQAAARLDHDHIARVYYYGEERGLHFIAYEYVAGVNLRDLLRQRGRLGPAEAVNYGIQIATALRHTSRHGVVHRDIKPSNIIVSANARAKLVDLGLAKRDGTEPGDELTVAGTTLGTFDYISPEQARDPRTVDVRSDIYSLGCTLYHLLTGVPPYPEGTVLQKLLDHQAHETPEVAQKNRRVPPALSAVVKKMMASDPKRRYSTPEELLVDLADIARGLGLRVVASDAAALVPASRLHGTWWDRNFGWALAAAALLLVVAGVRAAPELIENATNWLVATPTTPLLPTTRLPSAVPPEATPDEAAAKGRSPSPPTEIDTQDAQPDPKAEIASASGAETPAQADMPDAPPAVETTAAASAEKPTPAAVTGAQNAEDKEKLPAISIVGSSSKSGYATLEQACREAKEGDIIELRYNGGRAPIDQSLRLTNKHLTIRAAKGFRPQLHFSDVGRTSDQSTVSQMTVAGGSLRLVNVDVIANLSQSPTVAGWSLISLERPESLRLEGVSITILNPKQRNATIIEHGTLASASSGLTKTGLPATPPEIQLTRCVIRGAANLLTVRDPAPGRCLVQDSLVALEDSFLQLLSSSSMGMGETSPLQLELQHTTAILNGSLIVSRPDENLGDQPSPLQVRAQNNLISVGKEQPLVSLSLNDAMETRESLVWTGERNHYNEVKTFWLIQSRQSMTPLDFNAWKEFWDSDSFGSANAAVRWVGNIRSLPMHEITLNDVRLADSGGPNPAMNAATDGTDLGAPLDDLSAPAKVDGPK